MDPGSTPPQRARNAPILAALRLLQALAITVAACLVVVRFVAIDATSHSASDTLRPWVIQSAVIVALAVLVVVALERYRVRGGRPQATGLVSPGSQTADRPRP